MIQFAYPMLLWGLLALTLPPIVHLLLRPQPRPLRFPALALMRTALTSGQRAHRVRNLLLLFTRAALLATAVLLLAGPNCRTAGTDTLDGRSGPQLLIIDDAVRMRARPEYSSDRTFLDEARAQVMESLVQLGSGPPSRSLAVLYSGDQVGAVLTRAIDVLTAELRAPHPLPPHARPLTGALRAAARLALSEPDGVAELLILTDGGRGAWREVEPALLASLRKVRVRVVIPATPLPGNIGVVRAEAATRRHASSTQVPVLASVRGSGAATTARLVLHFGGAAVDRSPPVEVPPGSVATVTLLAPPAGTGPHGLVVAAEPEDGQPFDQQYFVALERARTPEVWIVPPSGANDTHPATAILKNMLAPETLPEGRQRVRAEVLTLPEVSARLFAVTGESGAAARGNQDYSEVEIPTLLVLFAGQEWDPTITEGLIALVQRGASLWLVPAEADGEWPGLRSLVAEEQPQPELLSPATGWYWDPRVPLPLSPEEQGMFQWVRAHRRLRITGPVPETRIAATFRDGLPAVLYRSLGAGRITLLATGVDPEWSDLGTLAAPLLLWLHREVESLVGPPTATAAFLAHAVARDVFTALPTTGLVRVTRLDQSGESVAWIRLEHGVPQSNWPTDAAGLYGVSMTSRAAPDVVYAVNWPTDEFDSSPITVAELRTLLGHEDVEIVTVTEGFVHDVVGRQSGRGSPDLAMLLATALFGLFLLEMLTARTRTRVERAPNTERP
ncbi:MAG: BatA domain-containing protein [Phycisphaerales bacterium]|nr:BatA domain-containing protein [Phycisphaerales bacterium]